MVIDSSDSKVEEVLEGQKRKSSVAKADSKQRDLQKKDSSETTLSDWVSVVIKSGQIQQHRCHTENGRSASETFSVTHPPPNQYASGVHETKNFCFQPPPWGILGLISITPPPLVMVNQVVFMATTTNCKFWQNLLSAVSLLQSVA